MKFFIFEQMEKLCKCCLCKKLCLGEFQEFGFSFELIYDCNVFFYDDVLDYLIDFVEVQGWVFGGGGLLEQVEISGYLCLVWVGSLDEVDWESVCLWLEV